jgi:glycosyltransferase involved in cell wall biosynthesis
LRKQYILWGIPPERIRFVQNGIDPTKFAGVETIAAAGATVAPAYLASMVKHKGLDVLIEAFNRLADLPSRCTFTAISTARARSKSTYSRASALQ